MRKMFKQLLLDKLDGIESKADGISSRVENIENRVEKIENKVEKLEEKTIPQMQDSINILQEKFSEMQKSLVVLETEVKDNFPALFEIYSLNYELQKEKEAKIDSLKNLVEDNSNRIAVLEGISKKN